MACMIHSLESRILVIKYFRKSLEKKKAQLLEKKLFRDGCRLKRQNQSRTKKRLQTFTGKNKSRQIDLNGATDSRDRTNAAALLPETNHEEVKVK